MGVRCQLLSLPKKACSHRFEGPGISFSFFHYLTLLGEGRQGNSGKGHELRSQVCSLPSVWHWVSYLASLLLLRLIYKMRIIISTLQGCCQNLKCRAIISKGTAPRHLNLLPPSEGFPLAQLLEKQGNFLLFWMFATLPDMIKQTAGGEVGGRVNLKTHHLSTIDLNILELERG